MPKKRNKSSGGNVNASVNRNWSKVKSSGKGSSKASAPPVNTRSRSLHKPGQL